MREIGIGMGLMLPIFACAVWCFCDDVMDSGLMVVRGLDWWWCRMKSNRSVNDLSNADCSSTPA